MITATVVIASAMGGVAGVLVGMAFNYINNQIGLSMGLKGSRSSFSAAWGASTARWPGADPGAFRNVRGRLRLLRYRDAIAFVAIIAILLIKPQGLFGQAPAEARR